MGNVHTNFGLPTPFRFRVRSLCGTNRRTEQAWAV